MSAAVVPSGPVLTRRIEPLVEPTIGGRRDTCCGTTSSTQSAVVLGLEVRR